MIPVAQIDARISLPYGIQKIYNGRMNSARAFF